MTKNRWLIFLFPLLVLVLALANGSLLFWRMFVLIAIVMLLAYLWTRLSVRGLKGVVDEASIYYQVGEDISRQFSVSRSSMLLTAIVEVREHTNLPGYRNTMTLALPHGRTHTWQTRTSCHQRGRYYLGAFTVRISDPLGLFAVTRQFGRSRDVVIFPETVELPFFKPMVRQEPVAGPQRWLSSETGPGASRVRDYTSGDSLRYVHWHTTAHTGKLMVKEFDPDRTNFAFESIWIVLDLHEGNNVGYGRESTAEYGITIAASMVKKYIEAGKKVGLMTAGDRPHLFLPQSGDEHMQHIMEALAAVKATGSIPIEQLLSLESVSFEPGTVMLIVMPSCNRKITPSLRRALNRGAVVSVVIMDSLSFGGKTSATGMLRSLGSAGLNVYIIERGMIISQALDYRLPPLRT